MNSVSQLLLIISLFFSMLLPHLLHAKAPINTQKPSTAIIPSPLDEPLKLETSIVTNQQTLPKLTSKTIRTHADVLRYVEQAAKEIILEELARLGVGNLLTIEHALSYFKALQKEFLVTLYEEYMQKIREKALKDMGLYFYLKQDQIKNMVFILLADYIKQIEQNIR